jgi:hypothetical protein
MRLNGNLVLNAGGSSEIQNAVIQRLSSLPTAVSAEKGRFVYNTTDGKVYYNDNGSWVALATGGNAALLQAEVDALEAALGSLVGTDGTFVAPATGIFAAATSVSGVIEIIKTTMAAETSARQAADKDEAAARDAADVVLQTAITAEKTRATAAEGTLTTNLAAEVTRATAAEGTLTTNLAAEVTRAQDAETTLTTNLASEVTRATAAEGVLTTGLNAEVTARTSGDSALNTALTAEVATRLAADKDAAVALAAEVTARTTADTIHTNDIAARVKLAGDTMGGDLSFNSQYTVKGLRAPALAGDAATKAYVDSVAAGLSWKAPVASVGSSNPGTATIGTRFLNTTDGKIYTATAADTFDAGLAPQDGWSLFDQATETGYVYSGSAWVQFTGAGQVTAGVGLAKNGNIIDINLGAGIAELPSDEVGIDLFTGGGLFLTVDGSVADATNAAKVAVKLDGTTLTRTVDGVKVSDATILRITTAENAITTEVSDRKAADALLTTNLGNEVTARTTADTNLQTALTAETTRATGAEGTLTTNLAAEVTRAQKAEGILTADLATEAAARSAADVTLQANITAEAATRAAEDAAINAKLGKIFFLYNGASATSHVVGHALNQKYCNVTVVDATADEVIIPQAIVFDSANQLTVTLNSALAIKVVVMGIGF